MVTMHDTISKDVELIVFATSLQNYAMRVPCGVLIVFNNADVKSV